MTTTQRTPVFGMMIHAHAAAGGAYLTAEDTRTGQVCYVAQYRAPSTALMFGIDGSLVTPTHDGNKRIQQTTSLETAARVWGARLYRSSGVRVGLAESCMTEYPR